MSTGLSAFSHLHVYIYASRRSAITSSHCSAAFTDRLAATVTGAHEMAKSFSSTVYIRHDRLVIHYSLELSQPVAAPRHVGVIIHAMILMRGLRRLPFPPAE